ncbi:hypothetical protein BU16DRAFT_529270 [Lophium mytilinum]|uniref:Uncharacterized protein n=1 Tax=Lophium mytilinum TaxID=390894 RepID=A0A6A6QMT0_9PEZI|nr:hypothetical protein BU16DRAFT_529270 [Lophium mytilinum]
MAQNSLDPNTPSPLLSLPREIRDTILELVISYSRPPPQDVSTAEPRPTPSPRWHPEDPSEFNSAPGRFAVYLEPRGYISNSASLLLVNRQISSKTAAALTLFHPPYELDVIFLEESKLWPTWLSVPALSSQLDQVNATIRISGHHDIPWPLGNGGPPWQVWPFFYLLEYVLRRGPVPHTDSSLDREVTIKNLDLNFIGKDDKEEIPGETPPPASENWKYTRYHAQSASLQDDETVQKKVLRPTWLAWFLMRHCLELLGMTYHTAQYGAILHERVGSIQFSVNGKRFAHFEIGTVLRTLDDYDAGATFGHLPREERVAAFRLWRETTTRKREERGLPI